MALRKWIKTTVKTMSPAQVASSASKLQRSGARPNVADKTTAKAKTRGK